MPHDHQPLATVGRFLLSIPLTLLLISGQATADSSLPSAKPESQGFSSERLERIGAHMQEAIGTGIMVGGQAMIARRGQVVFDETWGMADRESGRPMTDDALYRIYSMTKPITGVALMMLYEEGHFLLEDPVAKYLPELAGLSLMHEDTDGVAVSMTPKRQPTIRDLLRHTAGMTYGLFGDSAADKLYREQQLFQSATLVEFTTKLGSLPLRFEPGTRWHYSVSVDVQGRLVEVLSGLSFGEFLKTRIFEPLDMQDTFLVVPEPKRKRLTQLYSPLGTKLDFDTPWPYTTETRLVPADPELTRPYLDGSTFESGGGGLVSTSSDYMRFALMLASGGELNGVRLLSPRTVEHMHSNHLQGIDSTGLWGVDAFGLGVGIVGDTVGKSAELGAKGAYGWGGAAGTDFWVDPEGDIVGVFMVQSVPHQTPLSKAFRVLTYQALVE